VGASPDFLDTVVRFHTEDNARLIPSIIVANAVTIFKWRRSQVFDLDFCSHGYPSIWQQSRNSISGGKFYQKKSS
jgi:hypothetical protein